MDDYAALVERVCFVLPKVFGCLLLSEDGLVLSAYPDEGTNVADAAWQHFCALDEPMRGFLAFTDQHWAYVRHGAYAVFVVADVSVRPGVLIDRLEQVLSTAAISRAAGTFKLPEATSPTPVRGKEEREAPRVTERSPVASAPAPVSTPAPIPAPTPVPTPVPASASTSAVVASTVQPAAPVSDPEPKKDKKDKKGDSKKSEPAPDPQPAPVAASVFAEAPAPAPTPESAPAPTPAPIPAPVAGGAIDFGGSWAQAPQPEIEDDDEDAEVDRVQLAQEFSGLLQMDRGYDEGSS